VWVEHTTRDQIVDFVNIWSKKVEIAVSKLVNWIGISTSKFYNWQNRYNKINRHNSYTPKSFYLEEWEKSAIEQFYLNHQDEGYRRIAYMMLDKGIVAVSPSSVYRLLKKKGYLNRWMKKTSSKNKGFNQPERPHKQWHIDISYINIKGTFYYLCTIIDGYSRYIVHWEIKERMREIDVEIMLQRALEKFKEEKPQIISDNGPQFISREFKEFIRIKGMTHIRTSPHYPQSNGKIERWHKTLKNECIREKCPLSLEDAREVIERYVNYYNTERLHSSIGYIAPIDKLYGREGEIFATRRQKLYNARKRRKENNKRKMETIFPKESLFSRKLNYELT